MTGGILRLTAKRLLHGCRANYLCCDVIQSIIA